MANTIKLFGTDLPKPVVFGGAGVIGVAVIYFYRKNKQAQDAQASAAAQQQSVDQASSSQIDPATGYPYGSPEDAAALQSQSGYYDPTSGYYDPTGGYSAGYNTATPYSTGTVPGTFANNAEWAQYVEQYEINTMGADATTVGNAIGKYISGQPLTTDSMVSIVQSAIAVGGYPPVSGANGNPPGYITGQPTTTPPTTTTPPPSPTPIPTTKGYVPAGSISNLSVKVNGTSATVSWNRATGATQGYAYVLSEMNHVVVQKNTTNNTSVQFTGLHRGWTYNFGIQALPGGAGNNIHINIR